jgi:ABC-type transport system substrate-binding protein
MKIKLLILILVAGLISACGSQPATQAPSASQPTETTVSASEVTASPTETVAAPTPTEAPTQAPTTEPASGGGATVSYANDIAPILGSRCTNCHGGDRVEEGLNLKTYESLIAGSDNGTVITPGDANNSLLVDMLKTNKMPKRGPKLTPPQVQLIIDWINQGALNN